MSSETTQGTSESMCDLNIVCRHIADLVVSSILFLPIFAVWEGTEVVLVCLNRTEDSFLRHRFVFLGIEAKILGLNTYRILLFFVWEKSKPAKPEKNEDIDVMTEIMGDIHVKCSLVMGSSALLLLWCSAIVGSLHSVSVLFSVDKELSESPFNASTLLHIPEPNALLGLSVEGETPCRVWGASNPGFLYAQKQKPRKGHEELLVTVVMLCCLMLPYL